ncbi:charged multivesicular body protein 2b-B [Bacteroides thetaiotaomicron]|uniref:charged multivesicular body protein 2b-B n=1 Tax=Bacteroides thetaiotaomicron TaxID=818 RepID=UPI0021668E6D|nr:charged multivesicular body protein 2b-B [Bacteroides thetaiotaomicron]MCS2296232.1 charged multivesicular body protein 2b-B [Bacteroides thetaiotaomicron]
MGTTEHEEPRFFFILNKGAKSGGEITHAVLNGSIVSGSIVSKPAGWDAFHGLALAKEKLSSEEIQQQMKELGVEMEIVPLI